MIDGLTDGRVVDDFGFGDGTGSECGDADLVNLSWDALSPFGDTLKRIIGEKRLMIVNTGDLVLELC